MIHLDEKQMLVLDTDSNCGVLACPGAGKTRVLVAKTVSLLEAGKAVLAVTFTKDAAREIELRIREELPAKSGNKNNLLVGTFHSICLKQVKSAQGGGFSRLLEGHQQIDLMRRAHLMSESCRKMSFDEARVTIEYIKSTIDPPPLRPDAPETELYQNYCRLLSKFNAQDFSDLIRNSVLAMRAGSVMPMRYDWMLVDEAQDMDPVQYEWVRCHLKAGVKCMLVGDDDQSIYGWRHALGYRGMMDFVEEFGAERIVLDTNYRSLSQIVAASDKLISSNGERVPKNFIPSRNGVGSVSVLQFGSRWEEVVSVASYARGVADGDGCLAVLGRTNAVLDLFEIGLSAQAISYRRVSSKSFWESTLARVYLGILSSLVNDNAVGDSLALSWAGLPSRILESASVHGHPGDAHDSDSFLDAIAEVTSPSKEPLGHSIHSNYTSLRRQWKTSLDRGLVNLVLSGVGRWCSSAADNENNAKLITLCERSIKRLEGSLAQRLAFIAQNGGRKSDDAAKVLMMTIHGSKGLEFPDVWVVGVEENSLPHSDSPLEEERRLMYVAMTRAQDRLTVSCSLENSSPSRFLAEFAAGAGNPQSPAA